MSVRKTLVGVLSGALATTALMAAAPSAHAAEADDPTFVPTVDDLIGAGSDTTQHAMALLSNGWNSKVPAPGFKVASFAATGGGQIALPSGSIPRPNGSGDGKKLLYGTSNNPDVDYARSSSALSSDGVEAGAGLYLLPFAADALQLGVSASDTNAPATLTPAQIVQIYSGAVTNWSQVGGQPGVIAPKIPQDGSGTRATFIAQLKSMNGGVDVSLAASVQPVQEHDDAPIKDDENAIAPFSVGRVSLLDGTVELVEGWTYNRALYNVVREEDVEDAKISSVFGVDGYVCSDEAKDLIAEAGFVQLDSVEDGGVCGDATQSATTNFKANGDDVEAVETSTTLTATSPSAGRVTLTATVAPAATGTVTFTEGETVVGTAPVNGGVATLTRNDVAAGAHSYTAEFVPTDAEAFAGSTSSAVSVTVAEEVEAAATRTTLSASSPSARTARLAASVTPAAAGTVVFTDGRRKVAEVVVRGGRATATVRNVAPGRHSYTARFVPADAEAFKGSTSSADAAVVTTTAKVSTKFPKRVKAARAKGTVVVALVGTSVKATGKVVVKLGKKTVGVAKLKGGKAVVKLKKLKKGKNKLTVTWTGNAWADAASKKVTVTRR